MSSRADALIRLFRDDDPSTVGLVKQQLILQGEEVLPDLRGLVGADSAIVAGHAREVLHAIAGTRVSTDLEALFRRGGEPPLEEVTLLISSALIPWIDFGEMRSRLDALGNNLREKLAGKETMKDSEKVAALTEFLHGELGFTGNANDYYNHENSILASVLENRKGNPLALSLLYGFVAVRAGIMVQGVNLPGHFIARVGDVFFDPFHDGRMLEVADCADILARQGMELGDEHLEVPGSREVIARMLANLSHAYSVEEGRWQKKMVDRWMGVLTGAE